MNDIPEERDMNQPAVYPHPAYGQPQQFGPAPAMPQQSHGQPQMVYVQAPAVPTKQVTRRGANHGLHLVLSLLTCGLWAVTGWPIAAMMGRKSVTRSQ